MVCNGFSNLTLPATRLPATSPTPQLPMIRPSAAPWAVKTMDFGGFRARHDEMKRWIFCLLAGHQWHLKEQNVRTRYRYSLILLLDSGLASVHVACAIAIATHDLPDATLPSEFVRHEGAHCYASLLRTDVNCNVLRVQVQCWKPCNCNEGGGSCDASSGSI